MLMQHPVGIATNDGQDVVQTMGDLATDLFLRTGIGLMGAHMGEVRRLESRGQFHIDGFQGCHLSNFKQMACQPYFLNNIYEITFPKPSNRHAGLDLDNNSPLDSHD